MLEGFDIIVCDLDGTLCDIRHRQHLAQAGAWDEFHDGLEQDTPRRGVAALLSACCVHGKPQIVFLTGRPEQYRTRTAVWIETHCDMSEGAEYELLMRGRDVYGSDVTVKQELLERYLDERGMPAEERTSRVLILDDRDKIVAHFRDLGYEVWQVNEGAF